MIKPASKSLALARIVIILLVVSLSNLAWAEIGISDYFGIFRKPKTPVDSLMYRGYTALNGDSAWYNFKDALAYKPTGDACLELGKIAYARGLYNQSRILFDLVSDVDDETRYWLGNTLIILNQYDSAKVVLKGISSPPYLGFSYLGLGDVYAAEEKVDSANYYFKYLQNDDDLSVLVRGKLADDASTIEKPAQSEGSWKGWVIQFGAFTSYDNAVELQETIVKEGFSVRIIEKIIDSTKFYLVWAGVWNSMEEAESRARSMSDYYAYRVLEAY